MSKTLTAPMVAKLKPTNERLEIRDGGAVGLYLVIQPSGGKSWAMRFRRLDGSHTKLTLGPVDLSGKEASGEPKLGAPLTLAGARWLAGEVHRRRAAGRDVVADYAAAKHQRQLDAAETFAAAARDFITDHARPKTRRWRETARLLGLNYPLTGGPPTEAPKGLASRWASKPITAITAHDIYMVIDEARRRGVPGQERRNDGPSDPRGRSMARTLSKLFGWLLEHRRIAADPCIGVYCPPAPEARDRVLTNAEIIALWAACDQITKPFGALIKLLLLTGARRDEVARMNRGEFSEGIWTLPASRTKNKRPHVVPLPPLAQQIIAEVKTENHFVFTTNGKTPVSGFSKIKLRLDRVMNISPWRLHDLRRTVATGMAEIGIAPHIVEAVLNHVSGAKAGVAGIYNRAQYAEEKQAALERWADHISRMVSGKAAKVIRLR